MANYCRAVTISPRGTPPVPVPVPPVPAENPIEEYIDVREALCMI